MKLEVALCPDLFLAPFPPRVLIKFHAFITKCTPLNTTNLNFFYHGWATAGIFFSRSSSLVSFSSIPPSKIIASYSTVTITTSSLFSAVLPVFVTNPTSMIVTAGESVNFTCEVRSSPSASRIQWFIGNKYINLMNSPKITVSPSSRNNSNEEEGGVISMSLLTLRELDGFKSDTVHCVAIFKNAVSLSQEAILTVLGNYSNKIRHCTIYWTQVKSRCKSIILFSDLFYLKNYLTATPGPLSKQWLRESHVGSEILYKYQ